ncbi:unnamed protein product [Mycena citricolor]|uniref:RBR-type E3 ubiquitin transferase n=1 Tax=Mycena citricolor TaxID=2018698 RepID=A0AAD2Q759_9AGAR|nr:unnamed protein product [Mycena citricolor]CAK5283210.1 unnamed protein product [Mycena citricolor]
MTMTFDSAPALSPALKGPLDDILSGGGRIVSHAGVSQYGWAGPSACGLASMNFARVVFQRAELGLRDRGLLDDIVSRKTVEEAIGVCKRWPSNRHLEVEEIYKVALFDRALLLLHEASIYSQPNLVQLRDVLVRLESIPSEYAAVVITRPPEIITCVKLPLRLPSGPPRCVFMIFDSHPRPDYRDGAGLCISTSIDVAAARLDKILAVDDRLFADATLQWQTQLLGHFSGHFFMPKGRTPNSVEELTDAVMESSLASLGLRAEVEELKSRNSTLRQEKESLEGQLEKLKDKYQALKRRRESPSAHSPSASRSQSSSQSPGQSDAQCHSPARSKSLPVTPDRGDGKNMGASTSLAPTALDFFRSPLRISKACTIELDPPNDKTEAAEIKPTIGQKCHTRRSPDRQPVASTSKVKLDSDYMLAMQAQKEWDREHEHAVLAQRQYELEDERLTAERKALERDAQMIFKCAVCLEQYPEDYVIRVSGCMHPFCRDCLRQFVASKLDSKLYPIFCPTCSMDPSTNEPEGENISLEALCVLPYRILLVVSDDLIQMLGLDETQYQALQELHISAMSILIHCRKCKDSIFVDRTEYNAAKRITCPLPRCNHTWCKGCNQSIALGGAEHSCDGVSELAYLMKRRGWKHCPGCQTPFQKSSGCNHMTCLAPGCNTHFCYVCGGSIIRSAAAQQIREAVSQHYRQCRLFEDVPDI